MQNLACKVTGTWSASGLRETARCVNRLINIVSDLKDYPYSQHKYYWLFECTPAGLCTYHQLLLTPGSLLLLSFEKIINY